MAKLDPSEAATIAHGRWVARPPSSHLTSFAIDTRRIEPGETFVALRSDRQDGHSFLQKAFQYKAIAALVETVDENVPIPQLVVEDSLRALQSLASNWRQRFHSPVIGITGSNGKTTVKEMLGKVLGSQWFRTKGNYNNHIGVPLSLLELDPRTHAGAILEAGINDMGEMDLLAGMIRPDHVIVTSVGPSHLQKLGTVEAVAREKAVLAASVRPGGCVYIPADLLKHKAFRELPQSINVHALLREGSLADPRWKQLPNVSIHRYNWIESTLSPGLGVLKPGLPIRSDGFSFHAGSDGMISNLALVVHVALQLGVPDRTVQACLDAWRPFRQRGEILRHGKATYYVDCYNANPASMLDSAQRFKGYFPAIPHCFVLGTMNELGAESAKWHQLTAREMPIQNGTEVYLVGEYASAYAEGLAERGISPDFVHIVDDLDTLRQKLGNFNGAIFLKGSRTLQLESLLPDGGSSC